MANLAVGEWLVVILAGEVFILILQAAMLMMLIFNVRQQRLYSRRLKIWSAAEREQFAERELADAANDRLRLEED